MVGRHLLHSNHIQREQDHGVQDWAQIRSQLPWRTYPIQKHAHAMKREILWTTGRDQWTGEVLWNLYFVGVFQKSRLAFRRSIGSYQDDDKAVENSLKLNYNLLIENEIHKFVTENHERESWTCRCPIIARRSSTGFPTSPVNHWRGNRRKIIAIPFQKSDPCAKEKWLFISGASRGTEPHNWCWITLMTTSVANI